MPWTSGQSLYRMYIVRDGVKWYYDNTIGYQDRVHVFYDHPYFVPNLRHVSTLEGIARWLRLHGFTDTLVIERTDSYPDKPSDRLHIPIAIEDVSREEAERFYRAEGLLS